VELAGRAGRGHVRSYTWRDGARAGPVLHTVWVERSLPVVADTLASALRAKDSALTVPRSLWLTAETAFASPLGQHLGGQPPWVLLALHLLAERADSASRWAPYLALLPAEPESTLFWSDAELAELAGSQLGASAISYRAFCASTWEALRAGPLALAPAAFPPAVFNERAFAWAFATLRARCLAPLDAGSDIALVPGADLLNHRTGEAPAWRLGRVDGLFAPRGPAGDALVVSPGRALAAGEQLVGSYGEDKPDGVLALDRGFADGSQPGYLLQLGVPEGDRFADDKLDVLLVAELPAQPSFVLRPGRPPPEDLRTFLRLINLGGTDAFLLEPLFRDTVWSTISEPVSLDNERAACTSMIDGCVAALAGYPTNAREDEEALRADCPPRRALAMRVRLGEKRALQSALNAYQDILESCGSLEYYQERRLRSLKLLDNDGRSTFDPFQESFKNW